MTDGQVCHRCGTILVQQEVIPITHTILEYNVDSNYSHSGTCDLCGQYVSSPHEFEIVTNICSQCGYKHENQSKKWENNMVMQFFAYATIGLTLNVIVILVIVRQRKRENVQQAFVREPFLYRGEKTKK